MVVRIRLSRFGKKRNPIYNIVVSQARTARDSKPMEVLGTYDPIPRIPLASADEPEDYVPKKYKDIQLDISRTKYWLGVGAQPSDTVWRILSLINLVEPKPGQRIGRIGLPGKRQRPESPEILQALADEKAKLMAAASSTSFPQPKSEPEPEIAQADPISIPKDELAPNSLQIADEIVDSPSETPTQMLEKDSPEPREKGGGDSEQDLSNRGESKWLGDSQNLEGPSP